MAFCGYGNILGGSESLRPSKMFTNKRINIMLDEMNFLRWKQHVHLTVRSHRLESIMNLHCKLRAIKKEDESMQSYLTSIKEVCDALAACGSVISDINQVATILNGLPFEYQSFVAVITASKDAFTVDGVHSILIEAEAQLKSFQAQSQPLLSANIALVQNSNQRKFNDRSTDSQYTANNRSSQLYSRGRTSFRGRRRERVQCQLCGKMGHTVDRCWHRFDQSFSGVLADKQESFNDKWVIDSGATHHVTPDSSKLNNGSDYSGPGIMCHLRIPVRGTAGPLTVVLANMGVHHRLTCPHISEQNGTSISSIKILVLYCASHIFECFSNTSWTLGLNRAYFLSVTPELDVEGAGAEQQKKIQPDSNAASSSKVVPSHHMAVVQEEYNALVKNNTWTPIRLPGGRFPVGCKWLFRIKRNADGTLQRYKSRLVARGFSQIPGQDFQDTFSPVAKSTTINVILALAVQKRWCLRQVDINNAFLNGYLQEEVYMQQPQGFEEVDSDGTPLVCKLNRALYGLRQAPRNWYVKLKEHLIHIGFEVSLADCSLFVMKREEYVVYALVYVDNIIVTGSLVCKVEEVVGEALSGLIKKAGYFSLCGGITVGDGRVVASHIQFADDLLIFLEAKGRNRALLNKWIWRFSEEGGSLWRNIVAAKYKYDQNLILPKAVNVRNSSWIWRNIVNSTVAIGADFISEVRCVMGNGANIEFWTDHWTELLSLKASFPIIYGMTIKKIR
ncbi:hypothetical protein F3Y22_tig00110503pilonHSYRG00294 [Hibiscus syriacus]|uniref:Reverse transcriptase Ty1/copia-type domain-containing protein n=1 Tax=Hibiscus syriacus TaxID=106335 RepID=A0A6A3ADU5_HIBSY|nr:hypothetical protein F3Y22_tig00110503pilonHSYRG00294 [Hibiscus syriacus]